jgi:hypothetical protein
MNRALQIQHGTITVQDNAAPCPPQIHTFLISRNWTGSETYSNSMIGFHSMTWEQAVACEFFQFINLGVK